jgi:hypothetical protein
MAAWQLASIMNLKKDAYYTNKVSSNKGGMKIVWANLLIKIIMSF